MGNPLSCIPLFGGELNLPSFLLNKELKRYILKALCRNCNPDLLFPWSPICQMSKGSVLKPIFEEQLCGKWILCISFAKGTETLDVSGHFWQHLSAFKTEQTALLCEIWQGMSVKGQQFFLNCPLVGACCFSEIVIYRHLVVPLSLCLE